MEQDPGLNKMSFRQQIPKSDEIRQLIHERYPELFITQDSGVCVITGRFPVRADEIVVDHYFVEICVLKGFPFEAPLVREIGGRIHRHVDRHVFLCGFLCLFLPLERWKHLPETATILTYLDGPLNDYLFSQTYFEEYGCWPFGERGHGKAGYREYLAEVLGTDDPNVAIRFLECLKGRDPKGHWLCFCGSEKKMRNCHLDKVIALRGKVTAEEIGSAIDILTKD